MSEYFSWNFCSLVGIFVFLVSVTAATASWKLSKRDSTTLSRLAYFDQVYLTRHGQFSFLQKSVYLSKVTSSHIFNRKSTSSRFWSKSSRFHQIKSLPGLVKLHTYSLIFLVTVAPWIGHGCNCSISPVHRPKLPCPHKSNFLHSLQANWWLCDW